MWRRPAGRGRCSRRRSAPVRRSALPRRRDLEVARRLGEADRRRCQPVVEVVDEEEHLRGVLAAVRPPPVTEVERRVGGDRPRALREDGEAVAAQVARVGVRLEGVVPVGPGLVGSDLTALRAVAERRVRDVVVVDVRVDVGVVALELGGLRAPARGERVQRLGAARGRALRADLVELWRVLPDVASGEVDRVLAQQDVAGVGVEDVLVDLVRGLLGGHVPGELRVAGPRGEQHQRALSVPAKSVS